MTMKKIAGRYLADTARVLGEVALDQNVNVWFGVTIRGDVAKITIGENTNIQDGAVVHCDHDQPMTIGKRVTIGHNAIVHGIEIADDALIGMGAILLGGSKIGANAMVAAGAVVAPGMNVPEGMLAMGIPAKVVRPVTEQERTHNRWNAEHYVELAQLHAEQDESDPRTQNYNVHHMT